MTYSESVQRLQTAVEEMEQDETVNVLLEKANRAVALLRVCREKLSRVDEEVKTILEELQ
ncbi:MAG: exodeoxyribonuclease VII small subunit [Tannerella sp.]|nr:exodeoxyribonuclease VII small subunit [Tannerella sp.]